MSTRHRRARPEKQSTFVLTLRAVPGVDGIRALRAVLKTALRRHGLRATNAREETEPGRIKRTQVFTELRRASGKGEATAIRRHNQG
jgi:hypothetical protein